MKHPVPSQSHASESAFDTAEEIGCAPPSLDDHRVTIGQVLLIPVLIPTILLTSLITRARSHGEKRSKAFL